MAQGRMIGFIHWLRGIVRDDLKRDTDKQLLERFVADRDEDAFALLIQRHGPMVQNVCRKVLGDAHEAEDAFQAVFLVLLHHISSVRWHESLGGWLYEVAYRTAINAGIAAAKRRELDREKTGMSETNVIVEVDRKEMQFLLNEEIRRLPAKYRDPVVLCYLEGRTYEEAAQHLGVGVGTISKRLSQGRDLLRNRLIRRGVAVSAVAVVLAAAPQAPAAVATSLSAATLEAVLATSGKGLAASAVSAPAAALAKSVIQSMFWAKMKVAVATLLTTAMLAGTGGTIAYQAWSAAEHSTEDTMSQAVVKADHPEPIAEKKEEANQADKEPEKALEKAVACTVEPADVPLVARLVVKKDSFVLDRGGLTAEEFRRRIQNAKTAAELPKPPSVDMVLELRNTGEVPLFIWTIDNGANPEKMRRLPSRGEILEMAVEFPKAENRIAWNSQPLTQFPKREIILMPGESGSFPIQQLVEIRAEGKSLLQKTTYWTEPGKYHLVIRYATTFVPRSEGDFLGLRRPIRITSEAFEVTVTSRGEP